jgi:hypothetical protein
VPVGRELVVMVSGAKIVMLKACVAVFESESVTLTVKLLVPVAVGVPLMTPLELRVNPVGRLPDNSDQVLEPLPPLEASVVL